MGLKVMTMKFMNADNREEKAWVGIDKLREYNEFNTALFMTCTYTLCLECCSNGNGC